MENDLNMQNPEISEEVMKELNISNIEDYRKIIMDDKKSQNKINKSKRDEKIKSKSKTQIKNENRKKEQILQRRVKNTQRNNVLDSLAKFNTEEALKNLEKLESSRNLTLRKRKNSKDISHRHSIEMNSNKDKSISSVDNDEILSEPQFKDNPELIKNVNNVINKDENDDINNEKYSININKMGSITDPWKLLDPSTKEQILSEIKNFRKKEDLTETQIDDDFINDIEIPTKDNTILIKRDNEIEQARLELPILKYEQEIMDNINHSLVTIISGETGSGKSTQIPQFLFEYGYTKTLGHIAITQPRRLAAIALSNRVSVELNLKFGIDVGYQIRFDSQNCSEKTEIKYMTDGILLKEIENDAFLFRYSVVVIDEAHERSINTDILIGLLSKVIKFRYLLSKNKVIINKKFVKPLRLIIMSATMRVEEFMNEIIFKPKPSYIKVEARQFPVTVHHLKRTPDDYLEETFKIICKIHSKLPNGGILVFLTGKKEINEMCEKLRNEFENNQFNSEVEVKVDDEEEKKEESKNSNKEEYNLENLDDDEKDINSEDQGKQTKNKYSEAIILPLFSSLPQLEQNRVFQKNFDNKRLIVISTNVAETSLTIPNIKYVVDSGKEKKRILSQGLSFSSFKIEFISQASADQRTGRAGRTGPGHCYRIYSNGLFAKMKKFNDPQIITSQLDQMILYLKTLYIKDINNFPFITFPEANLVDKSIRHLLVIGAIAPENDYNIIKGTILEFKDRRIDDKYKITDIGLLMSKFPLSPKLSRMIIIGKKFGLILYSIFLVATLSQESIFSNQNLNLKKSIDSSLINISSDAITYMNIIIEIYNLNHFDSKDKYYKFIEKYQINSKVTKEIFDLVYQLIRITKIVFKGEEDKNLNRIENRITIPTSAQQKLLVQVVLCGLIENISKKREIYDNVGNEQDKVIKKRMIYECNENNEECQISKFSLVESTDLICYKEIIKDKKANLVCNTIIQPEWLFNLGGELVSYNFENFVKDPFYLEDKIYCLINIQFGYKSWNLEGVRVEMNKKENCYYEWFARFLLEGKVFPKFREYENCYVSKPSIITNGISIDRKVFALVSALRNYNISDKFKLLEKWKIQKSFLLDIFCLWLNDSKLKIKCSKEWPLSK